jgi:hypothetical protein
MDYYQHVVDVALHFHQLVWLVLSKMDYWQDVLLVLLVLLLVLHPQSSVVIREEDPQPLQFFVPLPF